MLLSGRSLALHCRWNCCPRYKDRPQFSQMLARHGDWVFVNLDFIQNFTDQFVLGVRKRFVLVCQNSDREFNSRQLGILRRQALHIFSINCVVQDPMVTPVPIGFGDWSIAFLPLHPRDPLDRTLEVQCAFTVNTNPQLRQPCKDALEKDPRAVFQKTETRFDFQELLRKSKQVACPEGEGHDTHRIQEALQFGAIPIVLSPNPLDPMQALHDFPLKRVSSWDNIELNQEEEKKKLDEWLEKNPRWFEMRLPSPIQPPSLQA